MDTQNSFSSIIKQFTQMNANALETFERINQAVTTSDDSVTVSIDLFGTPDDDGNTTIKTYQIPSFGYLDREIKRLESNLKALTGVGTSDASVKLPDGSIQRIVTRKLKTPASDLTSLSLPTQFETTDNDFFEDFLNPLLTVKFDVSGQIDADTERVLVKRYIFPSSDAFAANYFDDNYRSTDEISYSSFINDVFQNGANVTIDEQVRDLPYKTVQYYGGFDVTAIENVEREIVVDGETVKKVSKLYTLNKLTYTDINKDLNQTELLGIGDQLLVNSGNNTTRYEIINLYAGTSQVELKLLEGFDAIKIGVDQLKIYKALEDSVSVSIHVGFDERQVVFFKAIDPMSKIIAENWSPGVGFYSNELEITNANGGTETLSSYYKNNVADFGQFIKSLKDDFIPPATIGVQPDPVELDSGNFKVVQINTHLTQNESFDSIKKLSNDKISVLENIKKLDENIVSKRSEVATKKYKSEIEKNKDKSTLNNLVEKRSSEAKLYSSIVNQIKSISQDQNITEISPKFRVRGFWSIPKAQLSEDSLPQEIVKFKIQYRYVSSTGKTSNIEQIPLTIKEGGKTKTTTGSFSNWIALETPTRQRMKDSVTGKYVWVTESVEDGQEVNFNQLDLPINLGENVEVRIKSISEAGYPSNPIESNWSNIITIEFPENLLDTTNVINLVEENAKETTYVQLVDELDSKGLYTHIGDSFTANEKYFSHGAGNIASGFLSEEQTPISLFDKLVALQVEIEALKEQIANAEGELMVTLVDEEGKTTDIQPNTKNKIFAGYYTDEVADLNIKKGHIVTKTYKVLLENTKATQLELTARIIGDRSLPVDPSTGAFNTGPELTYEMGTWDYSNGATPSFSNRIQNDSYYIIEGKYDLVPIQYQYVDDISDIWNSRAPFQSAQRKGQWIYSRYMDVTGEKELYLNTPLNGSSLNTTDNFEYFGANAQGAASNDGFIWTGTTASLNGVTITEFDSSLGAQAYDDGLFVHVDHPLVGTYKDPGTNLIPWISSDVHSSQPSTLRSGQANSEKQLTYRYDRNTYQRTMKMSFDDNDVYLLGGKSCGSYLFMSPTRDTQIEVDGDNKFGKARINNLDSKKTTAFAAKAPSLSVDIVFQYRMTDYFGETSTTGVDTSTGKIGGLHNNSITNLTYSKTIGIDLFDSNDNQFSFDLQVFAKYKPVGLNLSNTSKVVLSKTI